MSTNSENKENIATDAIATLKERAIAARELHNIEDLRKNLDTRTNMAFNIVNFFLFYVSMLVLVLLLGVVFSEEKLYLSVFDKLYDLLKIAIFPIVTLVIGYYFGREHK